MRCKECNVDLGEEYTVCPLCSAKAVDDEPVLKGISTAEYPKYEDSKAEPFKSDFPQKYILRAIFIVCILIGIESTFTYDWLWTLSVPIIMAVTSVMFFILALIEKGRLCHDAVMLLSCLVTNVIFLIASLIAKTTLIFMAFSVAVSALCLLALFIIKPKKTFQQMKALFSL